MTLTRRSHISINTTVGKSNFRYSSWWYGHRFHFALVIGVARIGHCTFHCVCSGINWSDLSRCNFGIGIIKYSVFSCCSLGFYPCWTPYICMINLARKSEYVKAIRLPILCYENPNENKYICVYLIYTDGFQQEWVFLLSQNLSMGHDDWYSRFCQINKFIISM